MKTIKFASELVPLILSGKKRATWRLFDDKDLSLGDELSFVDKATGSEFAQAKVVAVRSKTLVQIDQSDYEEGHEAYSGLDNLLESFRKYYGDKVTPETEVKILNFVLL